MPPLVEDMRLSNLEPPSHLKQPSLRWYEMSIFKQTLDSFKEMVLGQRVSYYGLFVGRM